jgi:hypothetical protein
VKTISSGCIAILILPFDSPLALAHANIAGKSLEVAGFGAKRAGFDISVFNVSQICEQALEAGGLPPAAP